VNDGGYVAGIANTNTSANARGLLVKSEGVTGFPLVVQGPSNTNIFTLSGGVTTGTTTSSTAVINPSTVTTGTGLYISAANNFTSGKLVDLQISSTGSTTGQTALNILTTGVNGTGGQTTYGIQVANTHSGTSNNVGLYATASGGTNNYAAIFESGRVGIGTIAPSAFLNILGTTEQHFIC
jgi:hypothetical protein